jgi:prevent-host-death family protein
MIIMSISIAQSRQQLSALIAAAQKQPQVITNRNAPVAVLVSADYFQRSEAAVKPLAESFYSQLLRLRETFAPQDETGLAGPGATTRQTAWQRANAFAEPGEATPA